MLICTPLLGVQIKEIEKNRGTDQPIMGAPGASRIDILTIFIDFWLHLGTRVWDLLGELFGGSGVSWGLSWDFLGILGASGGYWGALGKFFVNIFYIYPH